MMRTPKTWTKREHLAMAVAYAHCAQTLYDYEAFTEATENSDNFASLSREHAKKAQGWTKEKERKR